MRALTCLACLLAATAHAAPVYKWKDANGVTQYSESPPAGKAFETRQQAREPRSATPAAPGAAVESAQCTTARANLALLAGTGPLMHDTDGDGTPDARLPEADRANQRTLAETAVKTWCPPATG